MSARDHVAAGIELPYGRLQFGKLSVEDHARMRSSQLSALLLLMLGESYEDFGRINERSQHSLIWLASQLADEVRDCIPLAIVEAGEGTA